MVSGFASCWAQYANTPAACLKHSIHPTGSTLFFKLAWVAQNFLLIPRSRSRQVLFPVFLPGEGTFHWLDWPTWHVSSPRCLLEISTDSEVLEFHTVTF